MSANIAALCPGCKQHWEDCLCPPKAKGFGLKEKVLLSWMTVALLGVGGGCGGFVECDHWDGLPIPIAAQTEPEEHAVNEMNDTFGVEIFRIDPNGVQFISVSQSQMEEAHGAPYQGYTEAHCGGDGVIRRAQIDIREDHWDEDYTFRLMQHELFHLLGFWRHLPRGLMTENSPFNSLNPLSDFISQEMIDWFNQTYPNTPTHLQAGRLS